MPRTRSAVLEARGNVARSIGRRLAAGRERAGLTQLQAARALQVPQSTIAKLESGTRTLQFVEGLRLAELYSMAPGELSPDIEDEASESTPSQEQTPIAHHSRGARPHGVRDLAG